MKRLVLVHGMRQESRKPANLAAEWQSAIEASWRRVGIASPTYELVMPYYGDILHQYTRASESGTFVTTRGENVSPLAASLLDQISERAGVTFDEIASESGMSVIDRGIENQEWAQATARALGRRIPWLAHQVLPFVEQVDAYLTRPAAQKAVDDQVQSSLQGRGFVVVAHSLGTVICYRLLQRMGVQSQVELFVTLGSPLGIDLVREYLKPPRLQRPPGVKSWVNGSDVRDCVALYPILNKDSFCEGIENISDIANRHSNPHSIEDYLTDPRIAKRIATALVE